MLTVRRFPIEPGLSEIVLPWGAAPAHFAFEENDAFVDVVVNTDAQLGYSRHFLMVATGEPMAVVPGMFVQKHIGSARHPEGIDFHLFEVAG